MYFARLNSLTVRLSRFDLAFDIFNRPEIVNLQHIKGGVTHKVFYGRGGELETKYWGSSGSNVQVRLYDKNKEIIAHKREEKLDLGVNPFWWRLEFQLRTKIRQHQKEKNKSPQTIERRNESICGRIKRSINTESP